MIRYTTIEWGGCCGKPKATYSVPVNITPYELTLLIPDISLEDAINLLNTRIVPDESCNTYFNVAISRQVRKECVFPAVGSLVTVNIPAGRYRSSISQEDANRQAEEEFRRIAQATANQLGTCVSQSCVGCTDYRVVSTVICGEFRRNTRCVNGQCVDTSEPYFVCTGNCDGNKCVQPCTTCSPSCPQGSCPAGYNCVNGSCKINCQNAPCSLDCPNGSCQDPCTECRNGRCQPKSCPSGQICQNGICIDRPCNPECRERLIPPQPNDCIQSSVRQICVGGQCVDSTETTTVNIREGLPCGTNRTCRNGQCTENPCIGQGGSCTSGVCCSGLFCFSGTCVSSCPQGYIQQGSTCVVDNGPNVEMNQVTVTEEREVYYTTSNISAASPGANINYATHIALTANYRGQLVYPRRLSIGTVNSPSEATPPRSFDPATEIYIKLSSTTTAGIEAALNQYIAQELNPIFGADYTITLLSGGQSTWTSPTTSLVISGFQFNAKSPSSPPISGSAFNRYSGGTVSVTTVNMRISASPYNVPGYNPNPNSFSGFGFTTNWQNFTLVSQEGTFNLQGRISGSQLQVKNNASTRIFGNSDFAFRRLIGTFTVGTIVTKTLN
jgi:hypothetical protein